MTQRCSRRAARLLACAAAIVLGACAQLTEPGNGAPPAAVEEAEAQPSAQAAPTPAPTPTPPPEDAGPMIGTSHVLLQYKGSMRAAPSITRSKEEAKKIATEVLAKAKKGQDFAGLAKQYSDEPGAKERAGVLPKINKNSNFAKPFKDAAFLLKPGEISGVVETDFGFHIIKRTE